MKRVAVYCNPHSALPSDALLPLQAQKALWAYPVDFFYPQSTEELTQHCSELSPQVYTAAVIVGGDGTQNHAIRGLLKSQVPMVPFPGGTANDLAHELRITSDWDQVNSIVGENHIRKIDLLTVNGHPITTICGIGIAADVTEAYNNWRQQSPLFRRVSRKLKKEAYSLTALIKVISGSRASRVRIVTGNFQKSLKVHAVFVCNQENLGGNMKVAPRSLNSDQSFNVLIVPALSAIQLIHTLLMLKKGRMPRSFISLAAKELTVTSEEPKPLKFFGDGEMLGEDSRFHFTVMPHGVRVLAPKERSPT